MVKLSNAEIDDLFERSARPGVSGQGGQGIPSIGASNTNLEPNMYNATRDDTQKMRNNARRKTLQQDQKINVVGTGFGEDFVKGMKKGFTDTIKTVVPVVLDVGATLVPVAKPARQVIKKVTGLGEPKPTLKKELGITGGAQKVVWSEFVKGVKDTGNLKFSDALKIASLMRKEGLNKISDINQQNVTMIAQKVL